VVNSTVQLAVELTFTALSSNHPDGKTERRHLDAVCLLWSFVPRSFCRTYVPAECRRKTATTFSGMTLQAGAIDAGKSTCALSGYRHPLTIDID